MRKSLRGGFRFYLVACTGFEPVNAALRGRCVEPLHQQAMCNQYSTLFADVKEKSYFSPLLSRIVFPFS